MKTNALNKKQARVLLRGNWVPIIAAFVIVLLAVLAVLVIETIALIILNGVDDNGEVIEGSNIQAFLVTVFVGFLLVLVSPLLNGALRTCAVLSEKGETFTSEMFYFFRTPALYLRTVAVNLLVFLSYGVIGTVTDAYMYAKAFSGNGLESLSFDDSSAVMINLLIIGTFVFSIIMKLVLYVFLVHYQLFVYSFGKTGVAESTFLLLPFVFKNAGKAFRLILSFAGWFALCFFVVPALYAVPYFSVASANSVKWLLRSQGR